MPFLPLPTRLTFTPKDPADIDEFGVDFTAILAECNDTIASVTLTTAPDNTNLGIYDITNNMTQVFWFASGGVNGVNYQIDISITTNLSPVAREINRTALLPVFIR